MQTLMLAALAAFAVLQVADCSVLLRRDAVGPQTTANINSYIDKVISTMHTFLLEKGYDPMALPDQLKSFSAEDLIGIRWHGEIGLRNGSLEHLSDISRAGDATMKFVNHTVEISAVVSFKELQLNYGYVCELMAIGPNGNVDAEIENLVMLVEIEAELNSMKVQLKDLKIIDTSKITVHVHGFGLLDNVIDAIAEVVTTVFKKQIVGAVEDRIKTEAQNAVGSIDIGSVLGSAR